MGASIAAVELAAPAESEPKFCSCWNGFVLSHCRPETPQSDNTCDLHFVAGLTGVNNPEARGQAIAIYNDRNLVVGIAEESTHKRPSGIGSLEGDGRVDISADLQNSFVGVGGVHRQSRSRDEHDLLRRIDRWLQMLLRLCCKVQDCLLFSIGLLFVFEAGSHGNINRLCDRDRRSILRSRLEAIFNDRLECKHIQIIANWIEEEDVPGFSVGIDDEGEHDVPLLLAFAMVRDVLV